MPSQKPVVALPTNMPDALRTIKALREERNQLAEAVRLNTTPAWVIDEVLLENKKLKAAMLVLWKGTVGDTKGVIAALYKEATGEELHKIQT